MNQTDLLIKKHKEKFYFFIKHYALSFVKRKVNVKKYLNRVGPFTLIPLSNSPDCGNLVESIYSQILEYYVLKSGYPRVQHLTHFFRLAWASILSATSPVYGHSDSAMEKLRKNLKIGILDHYKNKLSVLDYSGLSEDLEVLLSVNLENNIELENKLSDLDQEPILESVRNCLVKDLSASSEPIQLVNDSSLLLSEHWYAVLL